MAASPRPPSSSTSFNPKGFLTHAGVGKTLKKYRKNAVIFSQGEVAGTVFYIQKGKSRCYPSRARKPW